MLDRQQLEVFHQHLIAIERAGFRIRSQLLQPAEDVASSDHSETDLLKIRLGQIVSQMPAQANADDARKYLANHTLVSKLYLYSLQRWLDADGKIASLEHLLRDDGLSRTARQGLSHTWLHLIAFSFFGMLSLSIVWMLSHEGIQSLVDQMGIEPPWALGFLLRLKPYFLPLIVGYIACVLAVAWLLRYRALNTRGATSARVAFDRSQLAAVMSWQNEQASESEGTAETAAAEVASVSASPLIQWASQEAPKQGLDAKNVLALTKRLFLWLSFARSRRNSLGGSQLSIAAIGGTIALGAGLLLFYPLVQLLLIVIDATGNSQ